MGLTHYTARQARALLGIPQPSRARRGMDWSAQAMADLQGKLAAHVGEAWRDHRLADRAGRLLANPVEPITRNYLCLCCGAVVYDLLKHARTAHEWRAEEYREACGLSKAAVLGRGVYRGRGRYPGRGRIDWKRFLEGIRAGRRVYELVGRPGMPATSATVRQKARDNAKFLQTFEDAQRSGWGKVIRRGYRYGRAGGPCTDELAEELGRRLDAGETFKEIKASWPECPDVQAVWRRVRWDADLAHSWWTRDRAMVGQSGVPRLPWVEIKRILRTSDVPLMHLRAMPGFPSQSAIWKRTQRDGELAEIMASRVPRKMHAIERRRLEDAVRTAVRNARIDNAELAAEVLQGLLYRAIVERSVDAEGMAAAARDIKRKSVEALGQSRFGPVSWDVLSETGFEPVAGED